MRRIVRLHWLSNNCELGVEDKCYSCFLATTRFRGISGGHSSLLDGNPMFVWPHFLHTLSFLPCSPHSLRLLEGFLHLDSNELSRSKYVFVGGAQYVIILIRTLVISFPDMEVLWIVSIVNCLWGRSCSSTSTRSSGNTVFQALLLRILFSDFQMPIRSYSKFFGSLQKSSSKFMKR